LTGTVSQVAVSCIFARVQDLKAASLDRITSISSLSLHDYDWKVNVNPLLLFSFNILLMKSTNIQ